MRVCCPAEGTRTSLPSVLAALSCIRKRRGEAQWRSSH